MGAMLPSSSARSSGTGLLWGWRAAVLVGDPEEADPIFSPTKNTLPVHPGVTGKAGGSPELLLAAVPCAGRWGWGSCVRGWSSFVSILMPPLFVSAEKASSVPVTGRCWIMVSCVAK